MTDLQERILRRMSVATGSLTAEQLATYTDSRSAVVRQALRTLQNRGLVYPVNGHWWNPTSTGLRTIRSPAPSTCTEGNE